MINTHIRLLRVLIAALLLFSGVFLFSTRGSAQTSMVADSLLEEGKACYHAGDKEKAVQLLSKVLLIHPRNKEAIDYLKKMGLEGGIYGYQQTLTDRIYDLMEEISVYHQDLLALEDQGRLQAEQTDQLLEQRRHLEDLIRQKEEEKQQLMTQREEFYAVAVMKGKEVAELEEIKKKKIDELVRLNADMFDLKQRWVSDQEALGGRTEELATVKKDFDQYQKSSQQQLHELKVQYEKDLVELQERRDALERDIFMVSDDRNQAAKRFDDALRRKDAELRLQQGRLAVTSYQLVQQETQLLKAREQIEILYQQRGELVKEAGALQEQIRQLQLDKTFRYARAASDPPQKMLVDHIKKQDSVIIDLKTRLVKLLEEEGALRQEDSLAAESRIEALHEEIRNLRREISDREKELAFSKEQTASLEERIDDYQERLDIVEQMIKDKEERILFLEKEIGSDIFLHQE